MDERGHVLLDGPDLLAHRLDRQLEISRILMKLVERGLAQFDRHIDFRSRPGSAGEQEHDQGNRKVGQRDHTGRPDRSEGVQQCVVAGDIRHAEPENADEGSEHEAAGKVAAARSVDVDAALKQMKSDASEAEARLQKLKQVGAESWSVLSAALAESRKAFDQANQAAWEALRGSGSKS